MLLSKDIFLFFFWFLGVQWPSSILESGGYFMVVLTVSLEHWEADIKFIPKRDLIIILKSFVVSWRKSVELFLKEILHKEDKLILKITGMFLANVPEFLRTAVMKKL